MTTLTVTISNIQQDILTLEALIFFIKTLETKGFFKFKIIITVLFSSFHFIYLKSVPALKGLIIRWLIVTMVYHYLWELEVYIWR